MEKTEKKNKIAVIGSESVVAGFRALGADILAVESADDALSRLEEACADDAPYAVVIVMEETLAAISESDYARVARRGLPAIVSLPGPSGPSGFGEKRLKSLAERAIGSSIL